MVIDEGQLRVLLGVSRGALFSWRRKGMKQITAGAPGRAPSYDLLDVRAFLRLTGYGMRGKSGKMARFEALEAEIHRRDPRLDFGEPQTGGKSQPDLGAPKPAPKDDPHGYLESRSKREHYLAKQAELEYLKDIGELVSAREVREVAFRRYRTLRDKLLNIPERVASVIAAERDPARCHKILTDEIKRVLNELAAAVRTEADGGIVKSAENCAENIAEENGHANC